MKNLLSRIWFPLAVATLAAAGSVVSNPGVRTDLSITGIPIEVMTERPDTVIYPHDGYKKGWTEDDIRMAAGSTDVQLSPDDTLQVPDSLIDPADTLPKLTARDTIKAPDSLRLTDPFRYKYYVALLDSATHVLVRDSLIAAGDTLDWPKLDSLYRADSIALAKIKFDQWYKGLSRTDRKKYDMEQLSKVKMAQMKKETARKDSLKQIKDSIITNTPRILETFAFADSLQHKRLLEWTHEQAFHKVKAAPADTGFNYRFHDYPFLRNDVNATWLGVAGSPVLYYNWFNRKSTDKVSFYEAQESWSYTPETVRMFNTKTPYTELAYFGTLFAGTEKESDNLHLLTSQNITPEFNFTLGYDRFGGGGILQNEKTTNKNTQVTANYLGKKYLAHAGYLFNSVVRQENGGLVNLSDIRDTTLNARELEVTLNDAGSRIKKNTVFLDQQYRIPFNFINTLKDKKLDKAVEISYRDSVAAAGDTVSLEQMTAYIDRMRELRAAADSSDSNDITTAFIGHSTEYSVYTRSYTDRVNTTDQKGNDLYNGLYYINPSVTADSLRVARFENKFFIRLQPWADDGIISKINAGIGNRMLTYYTFDPTFTKKDHNTRWNSTYLYAGAEGKLKNFIDWDAKGEYAFLGDEANDLDIEANLSLSIYPFRRARKSPVTADFHFETTLDEPEYYNQHMYSNHYRWDNGFSKISTTRVEGKLTIPRWNLEAKAGYALLANNIYYDTLGVIRQNTDPMSIISASLRKEFVLGILHLDNRVLFQYSSNQDVVPLPKLAVNLRYYIQFNISHGILLMQMGADGYWNTAWHSPAWNPALGVFHNQNRNIYNNGPYVDAFVNMQWKRATIFIKYENANQGWPMEKADYFSADRFISTQRALKIGMYWPFYTQSGHSHSHGSEGASSPSDHSHPQTGSNGRKISSR